MAKLKGIKVERPKQSQLHLSIYYNYKVEKVVVTNAKQLYFNDPFCLVNGGEVRRRPAFLRAMLRKTVLKMYMASKSSLRSLYFIYLF